MTIPVKDSTTARFFRSARGAFSQLFAYMGFTTLGSFAWYLLFGLSGLVQLWIYKNYGHYQEYTLTALGAGFVSIGLMSMMWGCNCAITREIEQHDIPSFRLYGQVFAKTAWNSLLLGLLQSFVLLVTLSGMIFYWMMSAVAFKLIAVVCFYIMLMWAASCIYQHPLLIEHLEDGAYHGEARKRGLLPTVIQRSVYMMMANLPYSFAALVGIIVWTLLCVVTILPLVLFYHVGTAAFAEIWTRKLLMRYDVITDSQITDGPEPMKKAGQDRRSR